MTNQTPNDPTGGSRFIDFFQQESLTSRAELALYEGKNHQRNWIYPFMLWGIKTLTWPLENKAIVLVILVLMMFAPIF